MDGVGEWTTTSFGRGSGNHVEMLGELQFPHSLGLLYSAFTYFCGFKVNSGEYKVMGLAPYGEPRFAKLILDNLIDLKPDGSATFRRRLVNYAPEDGPDGLACDAAGNIFVYASKSETQGMILTEAMYMGLPIVAVLRSVHCVGWPLDQVRPPRALS